LLGTGCSGQPKVAIKDLASDDPVRCFAAGSGSAGPPSGTGRNSRACRCPSSATACGIRCADGCPRWLWRRSAGIRCRRACASRVTRR
jgi:hypothetical protein